LGDQEVRLEVSKLYTPADAVAQGLAYLSLNDTKILARTINDWFRYNNIFFAISIIMVHVLEF